MFLVYLSTILTCGVLNIDNEIVLGFVFLSAGLQASATLLKIKILVLTI